MWRRDRVQMGGVIMSENWKDALYHFEHAAKMVKGERVEKDPLDMLYDLIKKTGADKDDPSIDRH